MPSKEYYLAHKEQYRRHRQTYHKEHREERNAKSLAYYYAHHEERKAKARNWGAEHRQDVKARNHAYYAAHPEKAREKAEKYRKAHMEERAEVERRRHARKKGVEVFRVDPDAIYKRDKMRCGLCGKRVASKDISLDHIIPLSKGGAHAEWNLQLAHKRCNFRKGTGYLPSQTRLAF